MKRKSVVQRYQDHNEECSSVAFIRDDRHFAAAGKDGRIYLYSVSQEQPSACLIHSSENNAPPVAVNQIKTCPLKKNILASCGDDGHLMVWDVLHRSHASLRNISINDSFDSHPPPCTSVVFSGSSDKIVYTSGRNASLNVIDLSSNKIVRRITVESSILSMDISSNGRYIALGTEDGSLQVFSTSKLSAPITVHPGVHDGPTSSVSFSDAPLLFTSSISEHPMEKHSYQVNSKESVESCDISLAASKSMASGVLATLDLLSEASEHSQSVFDAPSVSVHESIYGYEEDFSRPESTASPKRMNPVTPSKRLDNPHTFQSTREDPSEQLIKRKEAMLDVSSFSDLPSRDTRFMQSHQQVQNVSTVIDAVHEIASSLRADIRMMQRDFMEQFTGMRVCLSDMDLIYRRNIEKR